MGTRQAALASETALAAAKATQTAQAQAAATATVAARATGQDVLAAKSAWPQRLLESFAGNQLGWPIGLYSTTLQRDHRCIEDTLCVYSVVRV
jgi:hypothetical protein